MPFILETNSLNGGEGGIRTPGTLRLSGFQDRRDRPLCHLSINDLRYFNTVFSVLLPNIDTKRILVNHRWLEKANTESSKE